MINKFILILLFTSNAYAEDAGQMIMDVIENRAEIENSIKCLPPPKHRDALTHRVRHDLRIKVPSAH